MVKFQPSKLAMRVRFPLPALLPMKTGLKSPSLARKGERRVRRCAVLSFDSRLAAFQMGTGESKDFAASDFCSEEGLFLPRARAHTPPHDTSSGKFLSLLMLQTGLVLQRLERAPAKRCGRSINVDAPGVLLSEFHAS